jgi:cell division protein FtsN
MPTSKKGTGKKKKKTVSTKETSIDLSLVVEEPEEVKEDVEAAPEEPVKEEAQPVAEAKPSKKPEKKEKAKPRIMSVGSFCRAANCMNRKARLAAWAQMETERTGKTEFSFMDWRKLLDKDRRSLG